MAATDGVSAVDAVKAGDVDGVRAAVQRDPGAASEKDADGISAVLHARYRDRQDLVDVLLEPQPELDIFEAAAVGDLKRVQALIVNEPAVVEAWSPDGFTALHLAAFFGHEEAAEALLRHGALIDVASRDRMQVTPLHSAAAANRRQLISLLLTFGADPNSRQAGGWTPLHSAAANGDQQTVDLLLDAHAEPGLANDEGKTPAQLARDKGHDEVARRLESWTPGETA